jgi:hypothetical protein
MCVLIFAVGPLVFVSRLGGVVYNRLFDRTKAATAPASEKWLYDLLELALNEIVQGRAQQQPGQPTDVDECLSASLEPTANAPVPKGSVPTEDDFTKEKSSSSNNNSGGAEVKASNEKSPLPILFMTATPINPAAEFVRLIGCEEKKAGGAGGGGGGGAEQLTLPVWTEVIVVRPRNVVLFFHLREHARRLYRSLVWTSDSRFSLAASSPTPLARSDVTLIVERGTAPRLNPALGPVQYTAGRIDVPLLSMSSLVISKIVGPASGSADAAAARSLKFVPKRIKLAGLLPSALLDAFDYWQSANDNLIGTNEWFALCNLLETHCLCVCRLASRCEQCYLQLQAGGSVAHRRRAKGCGEWWRSARQYRLSLSQSDPSGRGR